jgi:hypothetical protein
LYPSMSSPDLTAKAQHNICKKFIFI